MALMALMAALFPPGHPYRWTTIGESDDVRAATLEEAHAFFRTYYHPGNVFAGRWPVTWRPGTGARAGAAPLRGDPHRSDDPTGRGQCRARLRWNGGAIRTESVLLLEDRVELPRLYLAWRTPRLFADGDAGMDIAGRGVDRREDVATVSHARIRAPDRDRRQRSTGFARAGRLVLHFRHGGGGTRASTSSSRSSATSLQRSPDAGPDAGEIERWSGAGRGAVRVSACRRSAGSTAAPIS